MGILIKQDNGFYKKITKSLHGKRYGGWRMVSIKDIASACKVSVATVSKALNGHKDVSEGTAKLVREKAKEMGYLPNSQARALKTNRTYNLGVLFAEKSKSGLKQDYFASILDSFKKRADSMGYDITFISGNVASSEMTFLEHCRYRSVDGVLLACVDDYDDKNLTELIESGLPLVSIDYVPKKGLSVVSDNYNGMRDLVNFAVDMGHRKIAYIYGDDSAVTLERIRSFRETMRSRDINIGEELLHRGVYRDPKKTEQIVKSILRTPMPERVTCIFVPDDFAALGAYYAAEELGLSVPDDISIAGFDGITLSEIIKPKLTTVRQDTDRLGARAAERLISLINKEDSDVGKAEVIKTELIKGNSISRQKL